MAKKNLLAANLKRPSLKREMRVTEKKMDEVVQKVADNPPAKSAAARSTSSAPASAANEATGPAPKRGRGRPRKENTAPPSPRSVHPKEGTKRLTLDIPQALHKKLKLLAIHQEISMKDYIIEVVERSLR
jgi:hypothetical protein